MALGPKEMEAAIIANLKEKTGKDLHSWIKVLSEKQPKTSAEAEDHLKQLGLGTFQSRVISMRYFNQEEYQDDSSLIAALFCGYEDQLKDAEAINSILCKEFSLEVKPCKGYLPVYMKGSIVYSIKPTTNGLYLGIVGSGYDFETIAHKPSLGGSQRMKIGFYSQDFDSTISNLRAVLKKIIKGAK